LSSKPSSMRHSAAMAGCKRRSTPRIADQACDTNPRIYEYGRSFSISELNPLLESR
jgi:hypothetical protein